MNKSRLEKMYVDGDFKKKLKHMAIDEGVSVAELTRKLKKVDLRLR
jgi:hypothetical protein